MIVSYTSIKLNCSIFKSDLIRTHNDFSVFIMILFFYEDKHHRKPTHLSQHNIAIIDHVTARNIVSCIYYYVISKRQ